MAFFDGARIDSSRWQMDWEGIRRGDYSDRYFHNGVLLLSRLASEGYRFPSERLRAMGLSEYPVTGDMEVTMQIFARREPFTVVAGTDLALAILQECAGYWEGARFVHTAHLLEVESVADGECTPYGGDPSTVVPAMRIRGRYRDFAMLETVILGVLTRMSRIATNTYHLLHASGGKPILFFPARYDLPQTQMMDGYAYWIGVQRYNADTGKQVPALVSTPIQASLWGGQAVGTVAHAMIACFLGDTVELMLQFARIMPAEVRRVALVDFDNDCVGTARAVARAFFDRYRQAIERGDEESARRYILHGVRPDTASNLRDKSLQHLPDTPDLYGVSLPLIQELRVGLDTAWQEWNLPPEWQARAQAWCRSIQIVATGGFSEARLRQFEQAGAPVDIYGIGSSFFSNSFSEGTNTDFTADVVAVRVGGAWVPMAKAGRQLNENPQLKPVSLHRIDLRTLNPHPAADSVY